MSMRRTHDGVDARHDGGDRCRDREVAPPVRSGRLTAYSTIGMSTFENDATIDGRQLRVEVVGVAADSWQVFAGGLSSCAFNLAHGRFQWLGH